MSIVLSETDPETGKTGMQAWTEYANDLYNRIPSDTIYEQYLDGLIDIEWDENGNFVGIISLDSYEYD